MRGSQDTLHSDEHRAWLGETFDALIEAIETDRWDHNNVQGHLAFADDHGFRAVPGSHRRPFTSEETAAFAGEDLHHLAPVDAHIGAGQKIVVPAGCAIWYNNNMIHSGWCGDGFPSKRRSLLFGMHSLSRPPTWHFRGGISKRFADLPEPVRAALPEALRQNVARRDARMRELGGFGDDPEATILANQTIFWTAGLRPASPGPTVAAATAAASSAEPSAEYLKTLLLYYEEEIEGEKYFHDYATKLTDPEQSRKMHLMGDVERHAADAVAPLLRKHGLTPRSDPELHEHATEDWPDDAMADWTPTLERWLRRFPGYIDDFEGLESLAPEEDLVVLRFVK